MTRRLRRTTTIVRTQSEAVGSLAHLQADCVLIGELHGSGVLRVDQVVVLGDEAHEVRDLPDDDAVRPGQAAGWGQVAAGVAGLQGGGGRSSTGTDGTGATQVGGIYVYEARGARWKKKKNYVKHYRCSATL